VITAGRVPLPMRLEADSIDFPRDRRLSPLISTLDDRCLRPAHKGGQHLSSDWRPSSMAFSRRDEIGFFLLRKDKKKPARRQGFPARRLKPGSPVRTHRKRGASCCWYYRYADARDHLMCRTLLVRSASRVRCRRTDSRFFDSVQKSAVPFGFDATRTFVSTTRCTTHDLRIDTLKPAVSGGRFDVRIGR